MGLVFFELQSVIAHYPAERHPPALRRFNYQANRNLDEYRVTWCWWSPAENTSYLGCTFVSVGAKCNSIDEARPRGGDEVQSID